MTVEIGTDYQPHCRRWGVSEDKDIWQAFEEVLDEFGPVELGELDKISPQDLPWFKNGWNAALDHVLAEAEKRVDSSTLTGPSGGDCKTATELLVAIRHITESARKA